MDKASTILPQVRYSREPYEVARDADALLILTEWPEFRSLDWGRIHGMMSRPLVIDGRNLLDPKAMMEQGFEYYSFGRPVETSTVPTALVHAPRDYSANAQVSVAP